MSRGFTLVEMIMMILVLAILSGFTFSVIWQYSNLYAEVRQGSIYGEASAALERISRELRDAGGKDAGDVYTTPYTPSTNPPYTAAFIAFKPTHGTPATTPADNGVFPLPQWVQYCTCVDAKGKTCLYRIQNRGVANQCQSGCPSGSDTSLMSRNVVSAGFQVTYSQGTSTPEGDSYVIRLELASNGPSPASISLMTRVSPRNYTSISMGRSFNGDYYDEIR